MFFPRVIKRWEFRNFLFHIGTSNKFILLMPLFFEKSFLTEKDNLNNPLHLLNHRKSEYHSEFFNLVIYIYLKSLCCGASCA